MFYMFRHHHMLPGAYRRLPEGEKVAVRAFAEAEHEAENKKKR